MKIILFGCDGQVGREITYVFQNSPEFLPINRQKVDLNIPQQIQECIREIKPDIVINAAAYTAVDKAESEPELAQQINGLAPKIIAEETEKIKAKFVHISTDYVFDGRANKPYLETDDTNPLGVYGKTKLEGEENIKAISSNFVIIRTAWVYGRYGKSNFVKTMLKLGQQRDTIRVVMDQTGCPTLAENIATVIKKLIETRGKDSQQEIYHLTDLGVCSWYDFAVNIIKNARQKGYDLKVKELLPILTEEYPTPAKRPAYSVLNTSKIRKEYNLTLPYWLESLERYFYSSYNGL
ncbi:MAG: dTDP-4-dehydrorhamnose reductase [Geminocystis sp.]|nr:dTDP-4-dehydrorhamnose reductase [Geminocystis sp.]HIK38632.1 dTDP-4-dehydrorhamnose reductase [Geminocystis sp. M7585_C2015_104]MCS7147695.1 dTDP-4-dehydrorhamnose reductase [Geminocystis sp.]MCX8078462.1 dTDP-4-dehydrorhamnose reductase [Geminocystis sp.]MDW8117250.1 dTDP-4-dehydrorhamnose reductase [Geminocystis sp.]